MGGEDAGRAATTPEDAVAALPALTFPDSPRMELDQLLGQLVERAQEVLHTQGRLRALLRAHQGVIGELAMPSALRRTVEAARELVGARYAGLAVFGPDGGVLDFVHSGVSDEVVRAIGRSPRGEGLLGALATDPRPIRLARLCEDPRSVGLPPGHPPMSTFLGVPVRVRGEVFAGLCLAESARGEFTAEDEELVQSLAVTAGVVIDNVRLYQSARARGEWLRASAAITRQLMAADTGRPLHLIAERSRDIAGADLVVVALPAGDGELSVAVAVGAGAPSLTGQRMPVDGSLSGRVLTSGRPLRLASGERTAPLDPVTAHLGAGPVLVVPLLGSQQVHGVLNVVRRPGAPDFSAADLDMASGFANQAGVALELAEARAEQQRTLMLEERERIAADLHDHVVQRLFAAGLSLNAVAATLGPGREADRVVETVEVLDDTIGRIRDTIFQLHRMSSPGAGGVRSQLLDVVDDLTPALGFEAAVRLSGPLDTVVDAVLAEDLVAVLREALTNVARHARATSAEVEVALAGDRLEVQVRDDGVGPGTGSRRSGLATMRRRAQRHGGDLAIAAGEPSGTALEWWVPVR